MLILAGEVTVTADSARGVIPDLDAARRPVSSARSGALAKLPRTATVRARTPVTALRIRRDALAEVARAAPSLLIDVIGRMGDRMRRFNGAISLYTHALAALERHEFDPALLDELRNPIPDLADFGQTFGRMAEQIILRRQRDDEMASAAVIQRALLPKVAEFAAETGLDVFAAMTPARDVGGDFFDLIRLDDGRIALGVGDVCGKGVPAALFMGITRTLIRINLRETPDLPGSDPEGERLSHQQQRRRALRHSALRRFRPSLGRGRILQLRPPSRADQARRRRGRNAARRRPAGRPVRPAESQGAQAAMRAGRPPVSLHRRRHRSGRCGRAPSSERSGFSISSRAGEGASAAAVDRAASRPRSREFSRGQPQFDDITCLALAHGSRSAEV